MIEAGGHGIHVPFEMIWDHEHEDLPADTERVYQVKDLRGVELVRNFRAPL